MELVQPHLLIGGRSAIFQMDMSVLSCPAELDQVFFIEAHTDCYPVARLRVKDETGTWVLPILRCRKGHAGSITDKRSQVEAKGLALSLLIGSGLGSKSARAEYDHQGEEAPSQAPEMTQDRSTNSFRMVHGVIHSGVPLRCCESGLTKNTPGACYNSRKVGLSECGSQFPRSAFIRSWRCKAAKSAMAQVPCPTASPWGHSIRSWQIHVAAAGLLVRQLRP